MKVISEGTVYEAVMITGAATSTKKSWKKIYKVIDEDYFYKYKCFKNKLQKNVKDPNEPQLIPVYVKNMIQSISLERGFFSCVISILCKLVEEEEKKS